MRTSLLLLFMVIAQLASSQSSSLNAYEHVIVPIQFEFQKEDNQYQLNVLARVLLKDEGFKVYMDSEERPLDLRGNTCKPLFLEVEDKSGFLTTNLVIRLKDCYKNVIFESEEGSTRIKEFKEAYQEALRTAFSYLEDENYRYDSQLEKERLEKDNSEIDAMTSTKEKTEDLYPNKRVYKFGGSTYWLVKDGKDSFKMLANQGKETYSELQAADKGSYIFNTKSYNGAAFFDADGNLKVEYMDEDLNEIQNITFRKID